VWRDLARHKDLVIGLTRRELFSPFAGSRFGILWSLLHPVLQMLVYMVVFSYIFEIRMGADASGGLDDYPAFVLSGLVPWLAWSALLNTACSTVINSASLVKQADFPAEVLPLRTLLVCLVPHLVSLMLLGLYVLIGHGTLPGSLTLLVLALVFQVLAMLGLSYILSAVCVFVRDIKEVVFVLTGLGMFLTPALYPPDMMASRPVLSALINLNPISHFVNIYRDALYWGELRHTLSWWLAAAFAALALFVGRRGFLRLRLFFGNFL